MSIPREHREHCHGAVRPSPSPGPTVRFRLNGRDVAVETHPEDSALDLLRERCGLTSPKDGCSPQGQCGCCLVLVDGHPRVTCAMKAEKVAGKAIETLEGLTPEERDLWARSFVAAAGLQCGFCIPGIVMRAKAILDKTPSPSRKEIAKHLDVHLCRCTGYTKILDAIELAAKVKRGEATLPPLEEDGHVGKSLARYQGLELALGERPYVDDLRLPDMLEGAVLLSAHARATVRKIDTSAAEAMPGVIAVVTAKDVPGQNRVGIFYEDWPPFIGEGMTTSMVGDVLCAVAATDEHIARAAAAKVVVDYEVHAPVVDPEASLRPDAPRINPTHENKLGHSVIRRGDADAALAASKYVVSGTWQTQRIEHLYLEPESCVAYPTDRGVKLFTQGQGIFDDRRQVAKFLALSEDDVEVELVPNGGAFGGKEDMSIQAQTALLARKTGRPVKLALSREESVRLHPKRHPIRMHYTVGADENGKLTAVKARMLGDSGAYASVGSKVLERAAGHACGAYDVPHVDVEAIAAYTNNVPCGAFRGFGANQAQFAMEGAVDLLAEAMGKDRWELRFANALEVGCTFASGQVFEKSVGLKKTLLAVKPHYDAAKAAGKAAGLACGIKNSGIGNGALEWGKVRLVIDSPEQVSLYNGYTEMGQGLLTVLVQCAVEATNLPAKIFRAKVDSTYQLGCGQTTGSRATLLGGRAVMIAAKKLRADLDAGKTLSDLVGQVYVGDELIDDTTQLGKEPKPGKKLKTHTAFGFATQLVILDGEGKLEKVVAAHDVGRAINPALCSGQIEGSVHMGLGYALTEELPCDEHGMPVTTSMREIGPLRAKDTPEIEVILVEDYEPEGPYGAKGVGEIGLVPTAPAVQGALHAFDGIRRYTLPMKDSPAARAIGVGKIRART
ncbi:MAG TPA: selenium-dependent xanthine dehydrogenase [Polyangiaceae bacterium]